MSAAAQVGTVNLGAPLALAYGEGRFRGTLIGPHELSNKTRVAFIIGGQGEWEGLTRAWINRKLRDHTDTGIIRFHPGRDGRLGDGRTPVSTGGNQRVDTFWNDWPATDAVLPRLTFSRMAYVALKLPPDPEAPGPELDWLFDAKFLKVRIFNSSGTQTSYAWSTTPAWQILDVITRKMIKREFTIDDVTGAIEELTAAEKARFDFPSFKDTADYHDADIGGGRKRFEGHFQFAAPVSLTAALEQMCIVSRSYIIEQAGKIYLRADQPRAYVFTLEAKHLLEPAKFEEQEVAEEPNTLIGHFNLLDVPKNVDIDTPGNSGAVRASNVVTIKTTSTHPYKVGDQVAIVGVTTAGFNGVFPVATVPSSTTFTYAQTGANETSGNGYTGMHEGRFLPATKTLRHEAHKQAVGHRGAGLAVEHRDKPLEVRMGNNTHHQVERALKFMLYRALGPDASPYKAPQGARLRAFYDSIDAAQNLLRTVERGALIRLAASVSEEFQGDYELLERAVYPLGEGELRVPFMDLVLKEYIAAAFSDTAGAQQQVTQAVRALGLAPIAAADANGYQRLESPLRNLAAHTSYRPLSNPLTAADVGSNSTVSIAAWTNRVAGVDISLNSGSVGSLLFGTLYFIYYDDPTFAGGAVTYQATTTKETALNGSGRFFVGSIITPLDGGPDTVGAGDGGSGAQVGEFRTIFAGAYKAEGVAAQFANPFNAIDDTSLTDYSQGYDDNTQNAAQFQWWYGFGPNTRQRAKSVSLKIESEVIKTGAGSVSGRLIYSFDNITSAGTVYDVDASRSKQIDTVTLSPTANLGTLGVRAAADWVSGSATTVTVRIFRVWVEVDT